MSAPQRSTAPHAIQRHGSDRGRNRARRRCLHGTPHRGAAAMTKKNRSGSTAGNARTDQNENAIGENDAG